MPRTDADCIVAANSSVHAISGVMLGALRKQRTVASVAISYRATNIMIKALAISNLIWLEERGELLIAAPVIVTTDYRTRAVTANKLVIEPYPEAGLVRASSLELEPNRVSSKADIQGLAKFIRRMIGNDECLSFQALGAGAVPRLPRAIAFIRGNLMDQGIDLRVTPLFRELVIDDEKKTAVFFQLSWFELDS